VNGSDDADLSGDSDWSYKRWYEENRDAVAERRRAKYHSDPEYKDRVLERNREYRRRIKEQNGFSVKEWRDDRKVDAPDDESPVAKPGRAPVVMDVPIFGRLVESELVYVGDLARGIGRSVQCVYQWERHGVLPKTPFSSQGGYRLYARSMVDAVKAVLEERNSYVSLSDKSIYSDIADRWRSAGVNIDG